MAEPCPRPNTRWPERQCVDHRGPARTGMNPFRRLHSADETFRDRAIIHFSSGQQDGQKSLFSISECVYLRIDLVDSSGALLCRYCWRMGLLCRRTFIARQLDDAEPRKPSDVIVCADGDCRHRAKMPSPLTVQRTYSGEPAEHCARGYPRNTGVELAAESGLTR
jgi:hypothetical protein